MSYRLPDQPIPWQSVPPFKPEPVLSQEYRKAVRDYLRGNGEPETAQSIINRTAPSMRPAVASYLTTLGLEVE
jgi:hypothetical protein